MWHKITLKRVQKTVTLLLLGLFLTCTVVPPIVNAAAKSDKSVITDSYKSFTGKDTSAENAVSKFGDDSDTSDPDTFGYIFGRLFIPGYLNRVDKYVPADGSDESMISHSGGNYFLCNTSHPENLVGYNCDLPNVSAQILQSFMSILSPSGVTGNARQNAEPAFGLGVPKGIPGKKVPVDQNSRKYSYTGLELFGYNLKATTDSGEWDQINVSSSARLLSNYGTLDKLKVAGSSIWNGAAKGVSAYVDNASLTNPISWFTAIGAAWNAGSSASINTILDTSDANVAMTHGWTRPVNLTANSYYNVFTLTDKQVTDVGQARISASVIALINSMLGKNPKVSKMLQLQTPPSGFKYDKNKKSDNSGNVESEKDQLKDWLKSNSTVKAGEKSGIDYGDPSNYNDFKSAWAQSAQEQLKSMVNDDSSASILKVVIKTAIAEAAKSDPFGDPTQAIGHYVCADSNGSPITDSNGNYKYVYEKNNHGSKEYLTPGCSPVRPTIQGGYFGDGYGTKNTDTRNIQHFHSSSWLYLIPGLGAMLSMGQVIGGISTAVIRFVALVTNTMLNFSFSPIMQQLGITKLVKVAFKDFSTSVFWPLLVLVIAYAGLMMFIDAIRTGGLRKFFTTFLIMLLVFTSAMVVFKNSDKTISMIEEVPLKVDNGLADIILNSNNKQDLCRATGSGTKNGIRSAQCMVWKDTIFNTWTYAQFGTGYNNLFANGTTGLAKNQKTLKNTNSDLVGNAQVKLGGGNNINNWAVYQLALMTSGTINQEDSSHPVGQIDNNIYRVVDAQAGPNNAKGRDTTYWKYWTGQSGNRSFVYFLGSILAILAAIAIWGFLITKIELTFLTAIMFIGLPIMLLFGLTPRGQVKLKGYLFTLLGLYAKRLLMVFLLCTMLRIWDGVLSNATGSYTQVFLTSATILLFFILYKPHLVRLLHFDNEDLFSGEGVFSGDPHAVRDALERHTPLYLRNKISRMRANTRGAVTGLIGGTLGGISNGIDKRYGKQYGMFLNDKDVQQASTFSTILRSARKGAAQGVRDSVNFNNTRENNVLTRMGLSGIEEITQSKQAIRDAAIKDIISGDNRKAEAARDMMNKSKYGQHYKQNEALSGELRTYLGQNDKNISKLIKAVNAAQKEVNKMKKGEGTIASTSKTSAQLDKLSKSLDKSFERGESLRYKFMHPLKYATSDHYDLKAREHENSVTAPQSMKEAIQQFKAQQESPENDFHEVHDTDSTKSKTRSQSKKDLFKDNNAPTVKTLDDIKKSGESIIKPVTSSDNTQSEHKTPVKPTAPILDEVKKSGKDIILPDLKNDTEGVKSAEKKQAPTAPTLDDIKKNNKETILPHFDKDQIKKKNKQKNGSPLKYDKNTKKAKSKKPSIGPKRYDDLSDDERVLLSNLRDDFINDDKKSKKDNNTNKGDDK